MSEEKSETTTCPDGESGNDTMNGATGRYDLLGEGPTDEDLQKRIREASIKKHEAGAYLFHAGQPATCFWLIVSGRVAQYRGDSCISELGPGRFLGMRTFMLEGKLETTAQVVEPGKIVELGLEFLKDFLTKPDAVLAFLREQERELFRLTEAGNKREVLLAGLRRQVAILERAAKADGQVGGANRSGAEQPLRTLLAQANQASDDLDVLARDEPVLWKALQGNEVFLRIFLAVKDVAEKLKKLNPSSRASRHE